MSMTLEPVSSDHILPPPIERRPAPGDSLPSLGEVCRETLMGLYNPTKAGELAWYHAMTQGPDVEGRILEVSQVSSTIYTVRVAIDTILYTIFFNFKGIKALGNRAIPDFRKMLIFQGDPKDLIPVTEEVRTRCQRFLAQQIILKRSSPGIAALN